MKFYDKLCKPAQLYLLISIFVYVVVLLQNLASPNRFTMGPYSSNENQTKMLIFQLLYIGIWTILLNEICKINKNISWLIVLFPFILFFVIFLAAIFKREGMTSIATGTHCNSIKNPMNCRDNCKWNAGKASCEKK